MTVDTHTVSATTAPLPEILSDISFRNMEPSEAVEERVRERLRWLSRVARRVTSARVRIEAPHRSHAKGKIYHVKLWLSLPGRPDLVVSQESENDHAHEDVYIAIRDAFDAARRQLTDVAELRSPRKAVRATTE